MARKIRWSQNALTDLEGIAEFIAADSQYYAATLVREFLDAAKSLVTFAERGRVVPEINDQSIREIFVHNYRLIYLIQSDYIEIVTLIHFARDYKGL